MALYDDGLNDFYELTVINPPQSSAQLVYLHLMHINHQRGDSGRIQISDRELELRTRLNKKTITEAKRTLKNLGLIDFKTDRDKPRKPSSYEIKFFTEREEQNPGQTPRQTPVQTPGQKPGQTLGQNRCVCYAPNTRADAPTGAKAAAPPASAPPPPAPPTTPPTPPTTTTTTTTTGAGARGKGQNGATDSLASALPLKSPEIEMDIHDIWRYETNYVLGGSNALEMETLAFSGKGTFELMHKAIIEGVASAEGKVTWKYVRRIFERMKNEKEGGERVGSSTGTRNKPATAGNSTATARPASNRKAPELDPEIAEVRATLLREMEQEKRERAGKNN